MKFHIGIKDIIASMTIGQMRQSFKNICEMKGRSYEAAIADTYGRRGVCKLDLRTRAGWERVMWLNSVNSDLFAI